MLMSKEDLLYEQYRQINIFLKRIINEEKDISNVKFYVEEIQLKIAYIYKLKQRIIKDKEEKSKNERIQRTSIKSLWLY